MMILVTYDVETTDINGQRRLRKVAKECQNYGQRVQNSVFECIVNYTQYSQLKISLKSIIDEKHDSIRFYHLGKSYDTKVETLGVVHGFAMNNELIL